MTRDELELELMQKELERDRVSLASKEMAFVISGRKVDIRRLESNIKVQEARVSELSDTIDGLKTRIESLS